MALFFSLSLFIAPILVAAQSTLTPTVMCMPDKCLQGYSNLTLGAKLSSPASPVPLHLLPGQYTSTTNPLLLHNSLTSSSSSIKSSAGFPNSNGSQISLPFNLQLQPGLAIFSDRLYSGQIAFTPPPSTPPGTNTSQPLDALSLFLSSNIVVIAMSSSSRIVLWDSVPDTQNLPSPLNTAQIGLVDIQITTCAPACSSGGLCSTDGKCQCQDGFTGQSCEQCSPGHFGPTCQKCPDNCAQCDEGISGTGRCLKPNNGGNSCNCQSGVCGSNGNCQCNAGYVTADDGTQCAKCAPGFFNTTTGDCKVCQVGCNQCADGTGVCLSCKSGFTQDSNDRTKCNPPAQITSSGSQCPQLAFANGNSCQPCASPCQSCSGGTSNDCTACVQGQYMFNGVCVQANGDGVCEGSNLIADNNKKACDSCGAKCTSCKIPNFNIASFASQAQCTGCIPGSFLSNGTCVDSCPSGTLISPQDNMTCLPCESNCATCSGSATFCLTCSSSSQLAANGQCVAASSCPQNTFASPSTSSCLSCHPDCATCTGSSFNQCSTCPPTKPVLSNGRCMPTCSKNEYWDTSSSSCKACDSSCGSCIGPGASSCLSCSNSNNLVLRSGSCVASSQACGTGNLTNVVNTLGACLSELITVPSQTDSFPPFPSVTGLDRPTVQGRGLEWWQILLIVLGCVFILVIVIWCCRRRVKKKREEERRRVQVYAFADASHKKPSWWKCWGKRNKSRDSDVYHPKFEEDEKESTHADILSWRRRLSRRIFGSPEFDRSSSSMEMGTAARGKRIDVITDKTPLHARSESDIKFHHDHHNSTSSTSVNSHSFRDMDDRDRDLERKNSLPHMISPPMPTRPVRLYHHRPSLDQLVQNSPRNRGTQATSGSLDGDEGQEELDMVNFIGSYRDTFNRKSLLTTTPNFLHHGSRMNSERSRSVTPTSSISDHMRMLDFPPRSSRESNDNDSNINHVEWWQQSPDHDLTSRMSTGSMYSQMTGRNPRMADGRQPLRGDDASDVPPVPPLSSKFSFSTIGDDSRLKGKLRKKEQY